MRKNCALTEYDVLYAAKVSYTLDVDSNVFAVRKNTRRNLINIAIHVGPIRLKENSNRLNSAATASIISTYASCVPRHPRVPLPNDAI